MAKAHRLSDSQETGSSSDEERASNDEVEERQEHEGADPEEGTYDGGDRPGTGGVG